MTTPPGDTGGEDWGEERRYGDQPAEASASEPGKQPGWWRRRRTRKKARLAAMSRKQRNWRRVRLAITWVLSLLAALMVTAATLFYTLSDVPKPQDLKVDQVAVVQYSNGSTMARIGAVNRTNVPLSRVPESVRWAVIAAEDRGFYSEPGVSVTGTLRAAFNDLTGGNTQGGSGITQQYVKNAYLNSEQTLGRKLKELAISLKLARKYPKDQILEWYLNTVYFGRGAYGIEAASEAYFGIPVEKLTVSQGAMLAGLLQAPSYYDPAVNPGPAKDRWNYVLNGMVSIKKLDPSTQASLKFPKTIKPKDSNGLVPTGNTAFIVQQVKQELQRDGISESELNSKGLRITTTIDRSAENAATSAIQQTFANLTPQQKNMKNALVAVNPSSGAVLAYYGGPNGKGYNGKADYNDYAGVGCRPPGSSFKPYTLATALTQSLNGTKPGFTIKSIVNGSFTRVIDGTTIQNDPSDEQYSGVVPVDYAMKVSLNTAFDGLAYEIGPNDVASLAHAAGVSKTCGGKPTLVNEDGQTRFNIGIGDYPVRVLDQAAGYATFANGGMRHAPYLVAKVTDANGHVLYRHKAGGTRAMDARVANDTTLTLEPIADWSGDGLANGRQSAAKTGTEGIESGPDKGKNSDAWMVGFTPQVSAAVWVGSGDSTHAIYDAYGGPEYGRDLPGKTWKLFMDTYLANKDAEQLPTQQQVGVSTDTSTTSAAPTTSAPPSSSTPPTSPKTSAPPSTSSQPPTTSATPTPSKTKHNSQGPSTSSAPPTSAPPTPTNTQTGALTGAAQPSGG